MAISIYTREGDTVPLVFPVLSGVSFYPSIPGSPVQLVLSGWDGRQTAVIISDGVRVRWLDSLGNAVYSRAPGELVAANSPYRAYLRIQLADGSIASAPQPPDYYAIVVASSAY